MPHCIATNKINKRRCKNTSIYDNGLCYQHSKVLTVPKLLAKLKQLKQAIKNLKHNSHPTSKIQKQIDHMIEQFSKMKDICSQNPDCYKQFKKLKICVMCIVEPGGVQVRKNQDSYEEVQKVNKLSNDIDTLTLNSSGDSSIATQIGKDYAVSQAQHIQNENQILKFRTDMSLIAQQSQQKDTEFQKQLETSTSQMKQLNKLQTQTNQEKQNLLQQLDKCRAKSLMVNGQYSQMVTQKEDQVAVFKEKYENMVGREISTNKSLEILEENEKQLIQSIKNLKLKHQKDLSTLQNMYADKLKNGETILSEREEELHQQIEQLQGNLDKAINQLEISKISGQEALDGILIAQDPNKEIQTQLLQAQQNLQNANKQLYAKQQELASLEIKHSQSNLYRESQRSSIKTEYDTKIMNLNHNLILAQKGVTRSTQELNVMREKHHKFQADTQNNINMYRQRLIESKTQLNQVTNELSGTKRILQNLQHQNESTRRDFQMKYDMKTKQMVAKVNADAMRRQHNFELKLQEQQAEISAIRNNQLSENARLKERKNRLEAEQENLEKLRNQHFENVASLEKQKQDYNVNIQRLEQQTLQIESLQNDHKRRMMMMNQSLQTDRQQYDAQIANLKAKIGKLLQAQTNLNSNLSKCTATRDGIIERVHTLENKNNKLTNQNIQIQSRFDVMKVRFDQHVAKLETDVTKYQGLLAQCDNNLQETSLVHDHIMKEKEQVLKWRKEAEELAKQFKQSEEANQKILMDRELAIQQKFQLETNVKQIFKEKEILDNKLKDTNQTIRDYRNMESTLRSELKRIANVYTTEINNRDATLAKVKNLAEAKERALLQKINDISTNEKRMKKRMESLQNQKEVTENAYVDNLANSAKQIDALIAAERLVQDRRNNENLSLSLISGKSDIVNGI